MRGTTKIATLALATCLLLNTTGCRKQGPGGPATVAGVPVRAARAVVSDVPVTFTTVGTVEAFNSVAVLPRVEGQVLQRHFEEGDATRAGDLLFTIDPAPYREALREAEARLATDEANLEFKHAEAERYSFLVEKGAVSRSEYERHRTDAAALEQVTEAERAEVERARLDLSYCDVRAPVAGRAGAYLANEGATVEAYRTRLVVINQIEPIKVAFSVPEALFGEVRRLAETAELAVEAVAAGAGHSTAGGRLTFLDNTVDPETGMILLKAEFANRNASLWPGQYADVTLTMGIQRGVVVVPAAAVSAAQAGHFAFVVTAESTVELREVELERWQGDVAVLRSGVADGELVVTDGQGKLKAGSRVRILATAHEKNLGEGAMPTPARG